MAKRFKLKFSRVISFQSCRSKDPANLPSNPVPSFLRISPVNHNSIIINNLRLPPSQPPSSKPLHHSSIRRHVTSAFTAMGCGIRSKSSTHYLSETDHTKSSPSTENFHWEEEEKYHVVAKLFDDDSTPRQKIYNSSASEDSKNPDGFLPPAKMERKKRRVKKKKTASRIRTSTSSADSGIFFSGDEHVMNDEETETLVSSSRSFSTDSSSEFNPHLETIRESPFSRKKRVRKAKGRCALKNGAKGTTRRGRKERSNRDGSLSPARLSRFQWLIPCTVEGKVRESFAVVKRSEDPHEDFKRSMMEMILEKEMFEEKDLEQLLHCFLSLNSRDHHGVIVQAFSEIWETLFCRRRRSISYRVSAF
uniref:Transcription repressor n=1 Tax=Salix viminalis TaxID=40686 RepID=A0A6N2LA32_SALVM